jgi:hypothetical protein
MSTHANIQPLVDAALNQLAQMNNPASVPLRGLLLRVSDKRVDFRLWDLRTRNTHNLDFAIRGIENALGSGAHHVNTYRSHLRSHSGSALQA